MPPKKRTQTNSRRPSKRLRSSELTDTSPVAASSLPLIAPGSIQNSNTILVDVQRACESGCLFEIQRNVWENIEESYVVNLYRGMAKLKLKINVKILQLLCVVVFVALHGEFERFCGFCVDCYYTL